MLALTQQEKRARCRTVLVHCWTDTATKTHRHADRGCSALRLNKPCHFSRPLTHPLTQSRELFSPSWDGVKGLSYCSDFPHTTHCTITLPCDDTTTTTNPTEQRSASCEPPRSPTVSPPSSVLFGSDRFRHAQPTPAYAPFTQPNHRIRRATILRGERKLTTLQPVA